MVNNFKNLEKKTTTNKEINVKSKLDMKCTVANMKPNYKSLLLKLTVQREVVKYNPTTQIIVCS